MLWTSVANERQHIAASVAMLRKSKLTNSPNKTIDEGGRAPPGPGFGDHLSISSGVAFLDRQGLVCLAARAEDRRKAASRKNSGGKN
jgi:hypothetical protein